MDIIGFLVILVAIGFAPRFGLSDAILTKLKEAREMGAEAFEALHEHYRGYAVRPTQVMLVLAAASQFAILAFATTAFLDWRTLPLSYIAILCATVLFAGLEVFEAYRIRVARPRYQPVDRQEPRLDEAGNPVLGPLNFPMMDDVTDEELVRYAGYNPERFSMARALMITIMGYVTLGVGLGYLGIQTESRMTFLLGASSIFGALLVVRLMAGFIGWALDKGVKLLEKVGTILVEQGLILLPNITRENIKQYLPNGLDRLINEERMVAIIRALPWIAARYLSPFIIFVAVFTNPTAAAIAGTFLLVSTFAWWYFAQEGGALETAEMRYKMARLLAYTMPALLLVSLLWPLVAPTAFGIYVTNIWDGFIGFWTGATAIPFLRKWWQNVLFGLVMATLLYFLWGIASAVGKNASESKAGRGLFWVLAALSLIPLTLVAWSIMGLGMNVIGKDSFRLKEAHAAIMPKGPAAKSEEPKAQSPKPSEAKATAKAPMRTEKKAPQATSSKRRVVRDSQCPPNFVESYRRIVGPGADPPCIP